MHVLLVDDDELVRMCLLDVSNDAGIEAIPAATGNEALAHAERHDDFRVLVSDMCLGYGMNGIALAQIARRRWPKMRVILMNGSDGWAETATECNGCVDSVLLKPFKSDILVDAVLQTPDRDARARVALNTIGSE